MNTKAQYKVRNWNAYDAALKQRGSITFWLKKAEGRGQRAEGRRNKSEGDSDPS